MGAGQVGGQQRRRGEVQGQAARGAGYLSISYQLASCFSLKEVKLPGYPTLVLRRISEYPDTEFDIWDTRAIPAFDCGTNVHTYFIFNTKVDLYGRI